MKECIKEKGWCFCLKPHETEKAKKTNRTDEKIDEESVVDLDALVANYKRTKSETENKETE